jgi:hypothetical protein
MEDDCVVLDQFREEWPRVMESLGDGDSDVVVLGPAYRSVMGDTTSWVQA